MRIFYLISFLLFVQIGYSQKLIPRVGLSLAKTSKSGSDTEFHFRSEKFQPGILVGLGYEMPIQENLCLYFEVTYIQKGQRSSAIAKDIVYTHKRNYSLSFLEVPILLKGEANIGKVKLYPHGGLAFGYGLGGKMDYYLQLPDTQAGSNVYTENLDVTFKESEIQIQDGKVFVGKPFDIGAQVGMGLEVYKKIILDIRYTFGLKGFEYFKNESDKNRVLQFSVCTPLSL